MISSVSAVSFKANTPSVQAQDPISRPGAYTKPEVVSPKEDKDSKKKYGFLKGLVGVVVAAAVVGSLLIAGFKKGALNVLDEAALKEAKFMKKVGHYLGVAGKWLDTNIWQKIPFLAKKAEEVVETAEV